METREAQFERRMVDALRKQVPVKDLPATHRAGTSGAGAPFDVSFELTSGKNRILVFAEIKQAPSPSCWRRLSLDTAHEVVEKRRCLRSVSLESVFAGAGVQRRNGIDFLDLAGNVSIQVPENSRYSVWAAKYGTKPDRTRRAA